MKILFIGDSEAGHLAKFHEAFREGIRRMLSARVYGRGYPGYDPSLTTYRAILDRIFPGDNRDVIVLASYNLSPHFEHLRFEYEGLHELDNPKAIILSDFWNITEHYPDAFPGWVEFHGINAILSQYPWPIKYYSRSSIADRLYHLPIALDPEIINDCGCEKQFDVGFIGAGVTEPHPFYPERHRIHRKLLSMQDVTYFCPPHPGYQPLSQDHPLAGANFAKAISQCRMFVVTGSPYRNPFGKYFEVMASRTLLLGIEPDGYEALHLRDGINYVKITEDNIEDKIRYYRARPELCERIATAGYETALRYHTIYARAADFACVLGEMLRRREACNWVFKTGTHPVTAATNLPAKVEPYSDVMPFMERELLETFYGDGSFWKHLPVIYALAIGLKAQRIIDLGIGSTTRALRLAASLTGGKVESCDWDEIRFRHYQQFQDEHWSLTLSESSPFLQSLEGPIDFVVHDAAHDYQQTRRDIEILLPKMRTFGIICIHDTQQPDHNADMLAGIRDAVQGAKISLTSLPFACGLTILRIEAGNYPYCDGGALMPDGIRYNTAPLAHPLSFADCHKPQIAPSTGKNTSLASRKIHLGCGHIYLPTHINIDTDPNIRADIYSDAMDIDQIFSPASLDEILMIHSFNYLNLWQAKEFLAKAARLLADHGTLIIETPNLLKAAEKLTAACGNDMGEYLEGVRALHAFDLGQIERHAPITPYACSWSPWHLEHELRAAGFSEVTILPPQTHSPWRDMRIEAKKGPGLRQQHTALFVVDTAMGHATAQVRGTALVEPLAGFGWKVIVADVRTTPARNIITLAPGVDLIYLLKISSLDLISSLAAVTSARFVFDLSDALWTSVHQQHGWHDLDRILATVDAIISDNPYVARYGEPFCSQVHIVPTATHVEQFVFQKTRQPRQHTGSVVIGWIGSRGTAGGLQRLSGVLHRLLDRHDNLRIHIIGADSSALPGLPSTRVSFVPDYDEHRMITEVAAFDIGIFPPPLDLEDYVVRGALKALIYMSAKVPAVCYNAGECADIITDGVTGMLATSVEEWERKLELLVTAPELRIRMGNAAFDQVQSAHSLPTIASALSQVFDQVVHAEQRTKRDTGHTHQAHRIRLLVIYDIEGWAWWHKANNLQKYLPEHIQVDILRMDHPYDHKQYDFILYFDPYLIGYASQVPPAKLIMGCSCPAYLDQLVELVSSARCVGGFVNNAAMHRDASYRLPNLFCCQNGVDEQLFFPASSPPDQPVACWVGNTTSVGQKGLDIIREACAATGVHLLILDREANRDQEQLVSQEQIRDQLYHRARFYLCASETEGTPNPALEALACGLPVISTRVGNMPELIRDGYNGYLVERSVSAFCNAIQRLKQADWRTLSANARDSILAGWTWRHKAENYATMCTILAENRYRYLELTTLLNQADQYMTSEHPAAQTLFEKALAIDPGNTYAQFNLLMLKKQKVQLTHDT